MNMAGYTSCDENVLELSPDATLMAEINLEDLVDPPIDQNKLEDWTNDLCDSGLANFTVLNIKHRDRPDCECVICSHEDSGDSGSQVEPQTPTSSEQPRRGCCHECGKIGIIEYGEPELEAPEIIPRAECNDIVVTISNPSGRTRTRSHYNNGTRRQRTTLVQARAEAQTWEPGKYLWDPTAREYQAPHDLFAVDDPRDPRNFTLVCAFGHDFLVPRNARMRYREWRRYLPIGRILIS